MQQTSWSPVSKWYNKIVGESGHYYHEHIILPKLKQLLNFRPNSHVLDIGCGQGVYARTLPKDVFYTGIDLSPELIESANKQNKSKIHTFFVADATQPLPISVSSYDHAVSILALQNMSEACLAIRGMSESLKVGGDITIILNHPCFRIPRQSSWEIDPHNKLEYRRINRYLSPLEIPINAHPGVKNSPITWTYHQPLSYYLNALTSNNCVITHVEEWVSDKVSVGKSGRAENRARSEFPLFLAIQARKI